MPAALRLHDLGALRIDVGGTSSVNSGQQRAGDPVGGRKPTQILSALLVYVNRRVSRDVLEAAAWGETSAGPAATLESHIWRLRKTLEPGRGRGESPTYLLNDSGGYRLAVNPDNVDSLRFAQLAEQGDGLMAGGEAARAVQRYELALELWRGRPFESIADQEWAAAAIARLDELHMQVREQHIEALLRSGQHDRTIMLLEELTAATPLRERTWSQLMRARYRAGRTEEALAAYRRAREVLLEQLGLEPGPLLRELHQRILDQDPLLDYSAEPSPATDRSATGAPAAEQTDPAAGSTARDGEGPNSAGLASQPVHVQLPGRLAGLIGREVELDHLVRLVSNARLVTVVGPAGCGKTRLAIEVARASAQAAPDGVWFVDLTAVEDPTEITTTMAATIALAAPVVGDTRTALRSYLRDRRVLLLLDNCEHLVPEVGDLVDDLLGPDSEGRVLATSREPLSAAGEVLWTLGPLPTRDDLAVRLGPNDGVSTSAPYGGPSPAAQLFEARVRNLSPSLNFPRTAQDAAEAEAICSALDGLPLAIELAAGRIRSASLAEIRAQAGDGLVDLARVGRGRIDHHQTIERSIQWSVRLLADHERTAHARLSVLPGVFTVEAASAVVGRHPIRPEQVPQLLADLAHRSLLTVVPGAEPSDPTRYRQLVTVRAHAARALLEDVDDAAATVARRTGFVLDLVAGVPAFDAPDTDGHYAKLEANDETLSAVLHHTLIERPDALGVQITAALIFYWYFRFQFLEWEKWASLAEQHHDADPADQTVVRLGHACLLVLRDNRDRSDSLVRTGLERAELVAADRLMPLLLVNATLRWFREGPPLDVIDEKIAHRAAGGDPIAVLYRDLIAAQTSIAIEGPAAVSDRVADLMSRATELDKPMTVWLAALLGFVCALGANDPATGVRFVDQARSSQSLIGARWAEPLVEIEADFAVLDGDLNRAVRLFSAARAHAFRTGALWPISPITQRLFDQTRQLVPADEFENEWRAGQQDSVRES